MSLQFIIDGYNVIKHPLCRFSKKTIDARKAFIELVSLEKLCGSNKNIVTIVFDGYPESSFKSHSGNQQISLIFSRGLTADEKIKSIVESSGNPKNIFVVSDDKEIQFVIRAIGAHPLSVETFLLGKKKPVSRDKDNASKCELNYSQQERINKELKEIWLR